MKLTGAFAGGAAALSMMPGTIRQAVARPIKPLRSFRDIKHVVLLMQENRSFDHYFGTMSGVRGFSDPNALILSNGKSVFYQPASLNPDGYLLPYHLDSLATNAQKIHSLSHAWLPQHAGWNHGKMDNWVGSRIESDGWRGGYTMGYYTRGDIPFHFALAEMFTICDAYHCSVLGPTYPNRIFWSSGTIDPDGKKGGPIITEFGAPPGGLRWTAYAEQLEQAGVSWKVYQPHDDFGLNCLHIFSSFKKASKRSALYKKGLAGSPVGQFEYDAMRGELPTVSWIMPKSETNEHPDHLPVNGVDTIASTIDAIARNPKVWESTVFILSYDENDGFFDHVLPPTPPHGTPDEFVDGKPVGGGFRVPCIIVSPWTYGGYVCSEPFDHTSQLQFLEKVTGVKASNISPWRRRTFGDMTSALRLNEHGVIAPVLPNASGSTAVGRYTANNLPSPKIPGAHQVVPTQEPGSRKHVAFDTSKKQRYYERLAGSTAP